MNNLLEIRDRIISFSRQYESALSMAFRFLMAFFSLLWMNSRIGYQEYLSGTSASLVIALICTLVPATAAAVIMGLVMVVQLFALAMEAGLVMLILLLLLCLLYFRFSPRDAVLIIMAPACSAVGLPYVLPVAGGLIYGPVSAAASAIGVVLVSFINFVHDNEAAIGASSGDEDTVTKFRFVADGIVQNRAMMVTALAVALASLLIWFIRRMRIRYAWYIAVVAGAVAELIVLLVGDMMYATNISIGTAFLGVIISTLIGFAITFFLFNLDYTRIENTQFEDDDYYYYVKAIPKNSFTAPNRTIKKINTSRHFAPKEQPVEEKPEEININSSFEENGGNTDTEFSRDKDYR